MIIIGDNKSANTNRLFELSRTIQPYSYLVSESAQLQAQWFSRKKIIGITAGASTPSEVIEAIVRTINQFTGNDHE
jgi:4-hydroxy-3-methylbut-2-enyl diphosphate reductase